jgi:hypothetical protein
MNNIVKYDDFLFESRVPIAWAKPTEKLINLLSFIDENKKVTKRELREYIESIPEDASGKKPTMKWARSQKRYIRYKVQEEEANYFSLTPLGRRLLKQGRINETS